MGFSIQTPTQILFGRGMKDRAAEAIAAFGPRGVLVHGANPARAEWLVQALRPKGCTLMTLPCAEEPTLSMLEAALATRPHGRSIGTSRTAGAGSPQAATATATAAAAASVAIVVAGAGIDA